MDVTSFLVTEESSPKSRAQKPVADTNHAAGSAFAATVDSPDLATPAARDDIPDDAPEAIGADSADADTDLDPESEAEPAGSAVDPLQQLIEAWSGISSDLGSSDTRDAEVPEDGAVIGLAAPVISGLPDSQPEAEAALGATKGRAAASGNQAAATALRIEGADATTADDSAEDATGGGAEDRDPPAIAAGGDTKAKAESQLPAFAKNDPITPQPGLGGDQSRGQDLAATGPRGETAAPVPRMVHPDAGAMIRQITDAVVTQRDDRIEIALSPEELGRVRMTLSGREHTTHVVIWAERPEVMDMLRRNAAMLIEQFTEVGVDDATLEFQDGRDDSQDRSRADGRGEDFAEMPIGIMMQAAALPVAAWMPGLSRLDIRL